MTQRILPLRPAPVTSYLHHAYPLSIFPQEKDFAAWFFSRFIQLRMSEPYDPELDSFNFYHLNMYGWPWLVKERLNKSLFGRLRMPFSKFVTECIDDGCYVYAYLNERYIPNRPAYRLRDYTHDTLLHGYRNNEFLLSGFTGDRTYNQTVAAMEELDRAYLQSDSEVLHHQDIHILRPYGAWEYSFMLPAITQQLSDYLQSTNTSLNHADVEPPIYGSFGIAAMGSLYEQLLTSPEIANTRNLHLLWEHKKIMLERLSFLRIAAPPFPDEFDKPYKRIVDLAQALRNYGIKREVIQQQDSKHSILTDRMEQLLKQIIAEERPILEKLYHVLDQKGD